MSSNDVMSVLVIVLLVINLLGLLFVGVRVGGQSKVTQELNTRLTQLEAQVRFAPTHADLASLRVDINKMAEATATLAGRSGAMAQMLQTIQDHLLEKDR
ncbi:hypothetical protein [Dyella lutea]|uniref:DUF2730 family protein n=1 Tax=Dyella lutea TaxID=2950441 RepID=A0ABT1FGR4_9GAMM|nr:hypothetical protein [Dyella lutea]MCP1375377.1 hypothetical protein [Dyella lutea]